jgi:hypothetical protein
MEFVIIQAYTIEALDNIINPISQKNWNSNKFSDEQKRISDLINGLYEE